MSDAGDWFYLGVCGILFYLFPLAYLSNKRIKKKKSITLNLEMPPLFKNNLAHVQSNTRHKIFYYESSQISD